MCILLCVLIWYRFFGCNLLKCVKHRVEWAYKTHVVLYSPEFSKTSIHMFPWDDSLRIIYLPLLPWEPINFLCYFSYNSVLLELFQIFQLDFHNWEGKYWVLAPFLIPHQIELNYREQLYGFNQNLDFVLYLSEWLLYKTFLDYQSLRKVGNLNSAVLRKDMQVISSIENRPRCGLPNTVKEPLNIEWVLTFTIAWHLLAMAILPLSSEVIKENGL